MHLAGFIGYSGAGKTTLMTQVTALLRAQGLRVSIIKHTHHRFDIDQPGKDSWRHRQAGAQEVLLASEQRWVLMGENPGPQMPGIDALIARMDAQVDWVLVEGLKDAPIPKIEVWRPPADGENARPLLAPQDPWVCAIASPAALHAALTATLAVAGPAPLHQRLFDLDAPPVLAQWLQERAADFAYPFPRERFA